MLNLRPKAARDDEPDLTPLIDMVFILLIFFILAASFAVRGIDLDLPPSLLYTSDAADDSRV